MRREGANPSLRVIVLPDQEFPNHLVDQLCHFLRISIPSLRTRVTDHTRTEKIGGDSIFMFCGHPSRAENRYDILF